MWKRKELKARGRRVLRRNFWAAAAVCFLLAITGAEFAESVGFIHQFSADAQRDESEVVVQQAGASNWDMVLKWMSVDVTDGTHPLWGAATGTAKPYFDALTAPASGFFAFLDRSGAAGWGGLFVAAAGMLLGLWFSIWVVQALLVGARRFFLEARVADHISIAAVFAPFGRGRWWNVVKAMLRKGVYVVLWMLTIVGGVIKSYSYRMVPYILAENPNAGPADAIRLSRRMMRGSKWRLFVLDATFYLQWWLVPTLLAALLSAAVGLAVGNVALCVSVAGVLVSVLALFYVNGYRAATHTELYIALRQAAIDGGEPLAALFLVPAFGGAPVSGPKARLDDAAVRPRVDPVFHYAYRHPLDYNRRYAVRTLILLFFAFAMAGWIWEVELHVVTQGRFINRGTMFGPWLPIYGAGGTLVLVLLKKLFKWPVATFFVSMAVCSAVEYFTSWYLEYTKGVRWWDYSGYFMNLNGRICLEGAVVFGLGCCAVVYFAAPALAGLLARVKGPAQTAACVILVALFSCDAGYSHFHPNAGKGITDYNDWQPKQAPAAECVTGCTAPKRGGRGGTARPD